MVKDLVKEMVVGSPLEPLARAVYGWVSTTGRYDRETLQVMDRILRPNSNCIDIGCYKGDMLREMLRRSPRGCHFALEPIPEKFERLKTRFPTVNLHNVAASDRAGTATFHHVVSTPALSGLARRSCIKDQRVQEIRVPTARLDDLIPSDVAVRFIKLDVEGAELLVFRGAVELIRRCHPYIVFEHGIGGADELGAGPREVYDLLTENGLVISLMDDWLKGHSPLAREAFCQQFTSRENFYFMAHT